MEKPGAEWFRIRNRGPSTRRMTASQDQKRFFPDSGLRRLTLLFTHPVAKYATRVGHPGAQEDIFGTQRTLLDYVAASLPRGQTTWSVLMNPKFPLLAELIAEFLGTFVLILFGTGVVAMVVLFPGQTPGEMIHGGYTNITLGWGLGVTMGIYVAGKVSGAHLNPAVTLALAVFRGFPWKKVAPYSLAQTAGAFSAAALVFRNYRPAFRAFDPNLEKTAGVFTTFPAFPAW